MCSLGLFLTQTANAAQSQVLSQTTTLDMQSARSVQSGGQKQQVIESDRVRLNNTTAYAVQWNASQPVSDLTAVLLLTKRNGDIVQKPIEIETHADAKNGNPSSQYVSQLIFVKKNFTHAAVRFRYTSPQQRISNVRFTVMGERSGVRGSSATNTQSTNDEGSLLQPFPSNPNAQVKLPKNYLKGTKLKIVPRKEWLSAKKRVRRSSWKPQYKRPKRIIIHHTAGRQIKGPAYIQSVWNYHTNVLDWGDIGYNFIIGPGGAIYKGRDGQFKKNATPVAAHTYNEIEKINFNRGSIGIALIGCFAPECDNQNTVTKKQRRALDRLLKTLARKYHIDPYGENTYKGYTGPNLGSHRDYDATLCPGGRAYRRVASFREKLTAWYPYADEEREDVVGVTAAGKEPDGNSGCCCAACAGQ